MASFFDTTHGYFAGGPGPLTTTQLMHQQSAEDADLFISLLENAIANGYNPNDPDLQEEIFSRGQLGGFNMLMGFDQRRVEKAVERAWGSHNA